MKRIQSLWFAALVLLIIVFFIGMGVRAQSAMQPIPILQSDAEEYRAGVNLYQEAMTHLQKVRYHACLVAQVTEEECGQPDLQGRGFVARLPKPPHKPETSSQTP